LKMDRVTADARSDHHWQTLSHVSVFTSTFVVWLRLVLPIIIELSCD